MQGAVVNVLGMMSQVRFVGARGFVGRLPPLVDLLGGGNQWVGIEGVEWLDFLTRWIILAKSWAVSRLKGRIGRRWW